ncbi:MAG: hypothetical protein J3R72DRAFT_433236 [Linnemannia gamsii]|nr:MAG: hypothetical protein J3R72DRAFT_433236 [Linnemannia gamsii]
MLLKHLFLASMSLTVFGQAFPQGLTPLDEGNVTTKACWPGNWDGQCNNNWCWATCDASGRWSWLVHNDGSQNWARCGSDNDCIVGLANGQMIRYSCSC